MAAGPDDEGVLPTRPLAAPAAAALAMPVTEASKAASEPEEVAPQRVTERAAPVTKTKSTRRLEPGDRVCPKCGQGNPPTRNFCSRCGETMANAEVVKAGWWARTFKRQPKVMDAGTRPNTPGAKRDVKDTTVRSYRKVRAAFAAVLLAGGVLYIFMPSLRHNVNQVIDPPIAAAKSWVNGLWSKATTDTETIAPFAVKASDALPKHPGKLAFDNITNTFWAVPWTPKDPPYLDIRFQDAQTLTAVVVHPGAPGEDTAKYLRPAELTIKYDSGLTDVIEIPTDGDTATVTLKNGTTFRTARITVTKVVAEKGIDNVAIAEIELKRRKGGN